MQINNALKTEENPYLKYGIKVIALSDVPDPTFAEGILGLGAAF